MTSSIDISPRLLGQCRYARFKKAGGTVLMIQADYFIQEECRRGFQELGWQVLMIPLHPAEQFIEKLLLAIVVQKPDMLFTVNHLGFDQDGVLTDLLKAIEMPVVSWFVDSPAYILLDHERNASPYIITPVWERTYEGFLRGFGLEHVFHLPLAGDVGFLSRKLPTGNRMYPLSFVGDSMIQATRKWFAKCSQIKNAASNVANIAANLLINQRMPPEQLFREISSTQYTDSSPPSLLELLNLASTSVLEATRLSRQQMVEKIASMGLHIFGDDGWKKFTPPQATLHPPVDYYRELPSVYQKTTINLNLTSFQMPTALNQRVFDAPLAGGFLLTDNQDDLELLFDVPHESATYTHLDELRDKVEFYMAQDSLRENVIRAARERILAENLYRHRIERIITYARRQFSAAQIAPSATSG